MLGFSRFLISAAMTPPSPSAPAWIWALEQAHAYCQQVEGLLSSGVDTDNPEHVSEAMGRAIYLYSQSGPALTSAKWHYDKALETVYADMIRKATTLDKEQSEALSGLRSPSVVRDLAKSRIAEYAAVVTLCERANASLGHALDGWRSILSNLKNERAISNYGASL